MGRGGGPPDAEEGTENSYPCGGMLKPLEQIPMAFLGQVSLISPAMLILLFSPIGGPNTGPGRLKCGHWAVFAESLDGKFL